MSGTATLAPAQTAAAPGPSGPALVPGAPRHPQVNLLPPEIRASRSLRRVKRLLVIVLAATVAVAGLAYLWAANEVRVANAALEAAEAETARILAAQKEFAEVPQVLDQLAMATEARALGTSTEVLWRDYLDDLVASAPDDVAFESIDMSGATPMVAAEEWANPLLSEAPTVLAFTGRAIKVPDTAAWIDALEEIPNFVDAYVTSVAIAEEDADGDKSSYYEVSGSVLVTRDAYASRFAEQQESE